MNPAPPEAADPLWRDGWYRFAHRVASPNFGPRPAGAEIDLVVVHSISLPPGVYGGDEVQRLFTNTLDWEAHPYFKTIEGMQVSSHFYVQRGGEVWQFVSCDDRAWHAGVSSWGARSNCNDFSIGVELEGLEGEPFEEAQYEALVDLSAALAQGYPITQIAGHEHIAPGRKNDPGAAFDWALMRNRLPWPRASFP